MKKTILTMTALLLFAQTGLSAVAVKDPKTGKITYAGSDAWGPASAQKAIGVAIDAATVEQAAADAAKALTKGLLGVGPVLSSTGARDDLIISGKLEPALKLHIAKILKIANANNGILKLLRQHGQMLDLRNKFATLKTIGAAEYAKLKGLLGVIDEKQTIGKILGLHIPLTDLQQPAAKLTPPMLKLKSPMLDLSKPGDQLLVINKEITAGTLHLPLIDLKGLSQEQILKIIQANTGAYRRINTVIGTIDLDPRTDKDGFPIK